MTDRMIGRLALRVEGDLWVAYYAPPDSMQGALFLGSIQMRFVQDAQRKAAYMGMMRDAVADVIEEVVGARPSWPDGAQPAPEHERAGRA